MVSGRRCFSVHYSYISQGSACFLKVAQFAATLEQYDRAIGLFESVAEKSVGNNLTKWSVREYLLKAGICLLCTNDVVRIGTSLEKYKNMDATFAETRECKLLTVRHSHLGAASCY